MPHTREFKQAIRIPDTVRVRPRLNAKLKIMGHFLSPASPTADQLSTANPFDPLEFISVRPAASQAFLWPLSPQSITGPTIFNVLHPLYSAISLTIFYRENRGIVGLERFVCTI